MQCCKPERLLCFYAGDTCNIDVGKRGSIIKQNCFSHPGVAMEDECTTGAVLQMFDELIQRTFLVNSVEEDHVFMHVVLLAR